MARQAISDVSVCLVNVTRLIAKRRFVKYDNYEGDRKNYLDNV